LTKSDLIAAVAESTGMTKKASEHALEATIGAITGELKKGGKIQLVGFGTFEVKHRAARTGRNPKTKEPINIAATSVPVFKAGKALKDAVGG
jgi:nucleoid DNA-binding protein